MYTTTQSGTNACGEPPVALIAFLSGCHVSRATYSSSPAEEAGARSCMWTIASSAPLDLKSHWPSNKVVALRPCVIEFVGCVNNVEKWKMVFGDENSEVSISSTERAGLVNSTIVTEKGDMISSWIMSTSGMSRRGEGYGGS
ncbi:uncharacterized protein RSE6_15054 [Rhynchosporium secalis]|uniref:Uncharacterized protein n=1 Tax=Rhynchosporium secalis TaxID=38038 RepID=A0A1E1MWN9_RHYSE|nr:uncharacterized protein RSE6_15054 [Rhynchosporium secalis]